MDKYKIHAYLNGNDSEEFDRVCEESEVVLDKWRKTGDISPKDNAATVSFKLYDLYSDLQKDMKNIKNPIRVEIVNKETIRRSLIYHRCLNAKINMLMALIKFGKVKNIKKGKGTESFIDWCNEMCIGW